MHDPNWLEDIRARRLAEGGLVAPHWPQPWGMGADPTLQLIVDDELRRAGVSRPTNTIGIGWAGPTLLFAGTPEQKDRYLFPLLAAEEIWCQLFSEPQAGSDLASLTTRAVLDGDQWVVEGPRSGPRTGTSPSSGSCWPAPSPTPPMHQGISYFICPMDAPGVTVRPLVDMTGAHTFNEVFLDERAVAGRQPGRCPWSGLVAGQGDPGQRAGLAVGVRRPVGDGSDGRRSGRLRCGGSAVRPIP